MRKRNRTFTVWGTIKQRGKRKEQTVAFYLSASDREDALWQAHHGVIEAEVSKTFPGAKCSYDLRKLKACRVELS